MGAANSRRGLTRPVTVSKCTRVCKQHMFWLARVLKCLCISKNDPHAKLVCKRSIQSYWQQAVQHCNLSDATLSRLCSTAEHRTMAYKKSLTANSRLRKRGLKRVARCSIQIIPALPAMHTGQATLSAMTNGSMFRFLHARARCSAR